MDKKNRKLAKLVKTISKSITSVTSGMSKYDVQILSGSLAIIITGKHCFSSWTDAVGRIVSKYDWNKADTRKLVVALEAKS